MRTLLAVAIGVALAGPAAAAGAAPLSAEDEALAQRAAAYLQALPTARGRFEQTDPRGAISGGEFWLQRPGKARFDYAPPSAMVVAADGAKVTVVDKRLKTIQSYPLAATPLSLFLARDIRLDRRVEVARVEQSADGFILVLREARHPAAGAIALTFAANPVALTGWTLTDASGATVRVRLTDLSPAPARPKAFFTIDDPKRLGG